MSVPHATFTDLPPDTAAHMLTNVARIVARERIRARGLWDTSHKLRLEAPASESPEALRRAADIFAAEARELDSLLGPLAKALTVREVGA